MNKTKKLWMLVTILILCGLHGDVGIVLEGR